MPIQSAEEFLAILDDPDQLDSLADKLAGMLPPPDLNDPNKQILGQDVLGMIGLGQPQQPGQVPGQVSPAPIAPPTAPVAPPRMRTAAAQPTDGSPSVNFARQLLGG